MRQQGRYLRFRHVFPELFVPGMQARRGLLRLRWFLWECVDFRPIWTVGAVAGLGGVLLTVSLFFLPLLPQLAAAARVTPAPAVEPVHPPPTPTPPPPPPQGLVALWSKLTMPDGGDDRRLATTIAEPLPMEGAPLVPSSAERWRQRLPRVADLAAAFTPYREPPGLRGWEPIQPVAAISDVVTGRTGVSPQAHPSAFIEKLVPPDKSDGLPFRYQVIVTNTGVQPLPDVTVNESVETGRVTAVDPPARVEPTGLVWRLGALAPGERRQLAVSLWTVGLSEVATTTEVELTEQVSMSVQVEESDRTEPGSIPLSRPAAPVEAPAFPTPTELPPFPSMQELPPFPNLEAPSPSAAEKGLPPFPMLDDLPPFPTEQTLPPFPIEQKTPSSPPALPEGLPPFPTLPTEPPTGPVEPAPESPPPGRPILKLRAVSPPAVAVGQDATTWYEIENVGTAPAREIVLVVRLPEGLEHFDRSPVVRYSLAELAPGEKRRARLITRVRRHGIFQLAGELQSGELREESLVQFVAPAEGTSEGSRAIEPGETQILSCRWEEVRLAGQP
jgi:hypothetical protein